MGEVKELEEEKQVNQIVSTQNYSCQTRKAIFKH